LGADRTDVVRLPVAVQDFEISITNPADIAQAGIAFSTGKNSKIRARKTDPFNEFK
jgi:hypothetical protein